MLKHPVEHVGCKENSEEEETEVAEEMCGCGLGENDHQPDDRTCQSGDEEALDDRSKAHGENRHRGPEAEENTDQH